MTINKALEFANLAHGGQFRKGGRVPYILHPMEAGTIAFSLSNKGGFVDEDLIVASILHDVIEDTSMTYEDLSRDFSKRAINLIKLQSEDKSKSWQERKEKTIDLLKSQDSIDFEIVILADKLSNLRAIYRDYQALGDRLWERFNVKDKESHKWYYSSIGDSIKFLKDSREYKEYMELLEVFN